jgi:hypothetical protein
LTIAGPQNDDIVGILEQKVPNPAPGTKIIVVMHGHAYDSLTAWLMVEDIRITVINDILPTGLRLIVFGSIFGGMGIVDGVSMLRELSKYDRCGQADEQDDMDDMDHVLNHLRQQYSYRIWALVGHSRGTPSSVELTSRSQRSIPICRLERSVNTTDSQLFRTVHVGIAQNAD